MKKFELLNDLPYIKAGAIYEEQPNGHYRVNKNDIEGLAEDTLHHLSVENNSRWFKELKDTNKPKFKVGDYAVYSDHNRKEYIKIFSIGNTPENSAEKPLFIYNVIGNEEYYYCERLLREPTEEELNLYFR